MGDDLLVVVIVIVVLLLGLGLFGLRLGLRIGDELELRLFDLYAPGLS